MLLVKGSLYSIQKGTEREICSTDTFFHSSCVGVRVLLYGENCDIGIGISIEFSVELIYRGLE
jgi:hypothetical protein